jgi:putative (di)nucleoside polyphosphate hydrolase
VVNFKRGVYASALRHLAPFARQIAGQQAIPNASIESRVRAWHRARTRPGPGVGQGSGGAAGN